MSIHIILESQEMTKRKKPGKKNDKWLMIIALEAAFIQLVLSVTTTYFLIDANVLPTLYTALIIIFLAVLIALTVFLLWKNFKRVRYYIGLALSVIISIILVVVNLAFYDVLGTIKTITGSTEETVRIGVYVLDEDSAQTINDAMYYTFGIMESLLREDTDQAIEMIDEKLDYTIETAEYSGFDTLADALLSGECGAIIISEDFVDMITEVDGYENFDELVREITYYEWSETVSISEDTDSDDDGVFIMYISGIDTYGAVSVKSRSDVNILAVVNTNTKQVLLVSTPRDYYVELSISNGVKDKLTHAGIYGVDVSVETLEMLYDTEIDYYFRLNFTGFEDLIDTLGGITVYSEYSFEAGGYTFSKGYNTMDGAAALAFARERHAFSSGDRQRGKNQMAVIEAVIAKLQTSAILNNFSGLLESLEGSFETDMSYSTVMSLVKQQLTDGGSWDVVSYSVDGTGTYSTTYSMNQSLYVMVPDEETVETAKELINSVLSNEVVSVE